MRENTNRVLAIGRKELIILASYRFSMVMRLLNIWYFAISFYFIGEFVAGADALSDLGVGYFEFVLVGSIVTSFAVVGLSSFTDQISEEQDDGTLEAVLVTPTPMWVLMVGSFIVPAAFVVIETVVLVVVGLGIFGAGVPVVGLLLAVPAVVLTTLSFVPLGLVSAAVIVLAKRGDAIGGPARQITLLLSGALYPVSVLPDWLQAISRLVPATYGVRATRSLVQDDASLADVAPDLMVLAAIVVVMLPISLVIFNRAVGRARRSGTLATY